jgi:hypothetical protein
MVFWLLTPCNFANGYQCFLEKSDLCHHSRRRKQRVSPKGSLPPAILPQSYRVKVGEFSIVTS